jgi:hypothetical protein
MCLCFYVAMWSKTKARGAERPRKFLKNLSASLKEIKQKSGDDTALLNQTLLYLNRPAMLRFIVASPAFFLPPL